jgi:hypothetical protein
MDAVAAAQKSTRVPTKAKGRSKKAAVSDDEDVDVFEENDDEAEVGVKSTRKTATARAARSTRKPSKALLSDDEEDVEVDHDNGEEVDGSDFDESQAPKKGGAGRKPAAAKGKKAAAPKKAKPSAKSKAATTKGGKGKTAASRKKANEDDEEDNGVSDVDDGDSDDGKKPTVSPAAPAEDLQTELGLNAAAEEMQNEVLLDLSEKNIVCRCTVASCVLHSRYLAILLCCALLSTAASL